MTVAQIHRAPCRQPEGIDCDFCEQPPTTHYHFRPMADNADYVACICDSEKCMAEAMKRLETWTEDDEEGEL